MKLVLIGEKKPIRTFLLFVISMPVLAVISMCASTSDYNLRSDVSLFIDEMVDEYQFSKKDMQSWLTQARRKQSIIEAISRPPERKHTWGSYGKLFLTDARIQEGIFFWNQNERILRRAEKEFGVPPEIIVAVIGIESSYGNNKGNYRVIDALSTLGFDYPPRASFFRNELKQFFLLTREQGQNPLDLRGSYAGAMGYGQFIPSSYRAYAIDYTNDDFADIWHSPSDAIGSVANYFYLHGWQKGEAVIVHARTSKNYNKDIINDDLKPQHTVASLLKQGYTPLVALPEQLANIIRLEGNRGAEFWIGLRNYYVITRYNHSRLYAMAVWQLSQALRRAK